MGTFTNMSSVTIVLLAIVGLCASVPRGPEARALRESQLDKLIDEVIYGMAQDLVKEGKDKIQLPDLHETFHKKIIGDWYIDAEIHMENGWFKNTTSLYRTSDTNETDNEDGSMTFYLELGMKVLQVGHEDFYWSLGLLHGSGDIDAQCEENSVALQLTINYDEQQHCSVTLDRAQLTRLGDFTVTFEPVGFLNEIKSKLFTFGLNHFSDKIKDVVNMSLEGILRDLLNKVDICGKLPF